jgi:hypothetical protein
MKIFEPSQGGSFSAYRVECKFSDSSKWVPANVVNLPNNSDIGSATPYPECIHEMLGVFGYEQAMSFAYQVLSRAHSVNMELRTQHLGVEVRVVPYVVKWDLKAKCDGEPVPVTRGKT